MAEQPSKRTKRRVKNPETFRERAIKVSREAGRPKRTARLRRKAVKTTGPLKPVGRGLKKLFALKPFRALGRILKLIGKVVFPAYFRNSWRELKLVTWPGWKESRRLTFAVIIFAVVFGASVALLDYGLDKAFKVLLKV